MNQWLRWCVLLPVALVVGLYLLPSSQPLLLFAAGAPWLSALAYWAVKGKRSLAPPLAGLAVSAGLLVVWPLILLDVDREAVAEAVFRHQLRRGDGDGRFLCLDGRDPCEDLMRRLHGVAPRVRRASDAKRDGRRFVLGSEPGIHGQILNVKSESLRRSWPFVVRVQGGYYSGPLAAAGYTYRLAWRFGRWVVVSERMDWIS